jgi:predicted N-acetyltransferase YhbS
MDVRPAHPSEYDEIAALVQAVFKPGDCAETVVTTTLHNDPRFDPAHLRVVAEAGRVIGVLNIIDRFVRFGSVQVRCAIVAPLAVAAAHQGTGVGSALMRDSLQWARQMGFQLSMLWGHTWLYPRYGYAPGIKHYEVRVPTHLHPRDDGAYSLRAYNPSDAAALRQVYHAETASTTLAEVRSDEPWEWRPGRPDTFVEVVVDPAHAVRGYMRGMVSGQQLEVGELFGMDAGAAQALFDRLLHLAHSNGLSEVKVTATPQNRWSRLAFRQGAQVCIGSGGGAGMIRVLDWPAFLETVLPELGRRIERSDFVARHTKVQFETPVGRATVHVELGKIGISAARSMNTVTLPFHALGPLVTGYLPIAELASMAGVFIDGRDTQRIIDVLFPEGYPHWPLAAYFS